MSAGKLEVCGGCGETDPNRRCIGCLHVFDVPSALPQPVPAGMEVVGYAWKGFDGTYVVNLNQPKPYAAEPLVRQSEADARIAGLNACAQKEADSLANKATDQEIIAASWKARALAAEAKVAELEARLGEQIAWRGDGPPKDGSVFYGHSYSPYRWHPYSPKSDQFKAGRRGRWQVMGEYGSWGNAPAPAEWATKQQIDDRRAFLATVEKTG